MHAAGITKCLWTALLIPIFLTGCTPYQHDRGRSLLGSGIDEYTCIDRKGKVISTSTVGLPGPFSEGYALGCDPNREDWVGVVDRDAHFVGRNRVYPSGGTNEPPSLMEFKPFHNGLTPLNGDNGLHGYMAVTGRFGISPRFTNADEFSEGLGAVEDKGKYGYIDPRGDFRIACTFVDAAPFKDGYAVVGKQIGKVIRYGCIDKDGKLVIPCKWEELRSAGSGLFAAKTVVNGKAKWGYLGLSGEWEIQPSFDACEGFSEGLAAVNRGDGWGYIDTSGRTQIPFRFGYADQFSEGRAAVSRPKSRKIGFIDSTGVMVISDKYLYVENFSEGLAAVAVASKNSRGELWGYIDAHGKYVVSPKYVDAKPFSDGRAWVLEESGTRGYVDT